MKIFHVLDHSLPLQSGYVYRTLEILRQQRALGFETVQLTTPRHRPTGPDPEIVDGFEFHRSRPDGSAAARIPVLREFLEMRATARSLGNLCAAERPDVIHAHSPVLNVLPALATRWRIGIPVVYEVRAFWEDAAVSAGECRQAGLRYRCTKRMESWALRHADTIIAISQGLRNDIVSRGIPAGKITIVPNAVDLDRFPQISGDSGLAQRLGVDGAFVLGFIGSFYGYEGLDLLLKALPQLRATGHDVRLILVGGGPEESRLRELAERLSLGEAAIFAGRVPHEEVGRYYSLIDLALYPRQSARLTELVTPLKPLEAMAMGVPVVASDVGGHRELIDDGRTGHLFQAGSVESLVRTILHCVDEPRLCEKLARNAREWVIRERSWNAVAASYTGLYEALLS